MREKICKISLFSAILVSVSALPVDAAVRMNNSSRSYADAYNQVNALRQQQEYLNATATNATTASATANLPVMVADEKLANEILNNSSDTTISQLESCSMIYPNGIFKWQIPESGIRKNPTNQCVAEISLVDANTNAILAKTTVAAGDAVKCNIDSFPESGMNEVALSKTMLPADNPPTMEDVESVMNKEQKQNAGFKIAAGALVSAVAGNMLAKKDAGDSKAFGTGKNQIKGTAIGAVTGAGIMAASSYTGKVAGDTIKSTTVNAASGMIVGNMMAGANDSGEFLVIKKCKIADVKDGVKDIKKGEEYDCAPGKLEETGEALKPEDGKFYIINKQKSVRECAQNGNNFKCVLNQKSLAQIKLKRDYEDGTEDFDKVFDGKQDSKLKELERYYVEDNNQPEIFIKSVKGTEVKDSTYYLINSAYSTKNPQRAYIIFPNGISSKWIKGGQKISDLEASSEYKTAHYVKRNADGTTGSYLGTTKDTIKVEETETEKFKFTPTSGSSDDGALIDLHNPGRAKGTLTGAAAGGALGGFAGYQGAQSEITDRWLAATREYEDSLSNFVCMTGNRFLSKYNDYVEIPTPKDPQQ